MVARVYSPKRQRYSAAFEALLGVDRSNPSRFDAVSRGACSKLLSVVMMKPCSVFHRACDGLLPAVEFGGKALAAQS